MAGAADRDKLGEGSCCQPSPLFAIKGPILAAKAGGLCNFQAETLSLLAWRTLRLLAGDSSISLRMARRSSVAETTGKRMTRTQPKASRHCSGVNLRPAEGVLEPRHSQQAGNASSSHARLSSSSMKPKRDSQN